MTKRIYGIELSNGSLWIGDKNIPFIGIGKKDTQKALSHWKRKYTRYEILFHKAKIVPVGIGVVVSRNPLKETKRGFEWT